MTDEELFTDIERKLRREAEDALGFLSFSDIGNELSIVSEVDRTAIVPSAKLVRVGILQSLALCACRMCDRGHDAYSIFRVHRMLQRDDLKKGVVESMDDLSRFDALVTMIGLDPDTKRLKHFRDTALAHLIPGKYAAGPTADMDSLFRVSKLAIDAVFVLNSATGSIRVGMPAVYETWHARNLAYWNQLLGRAAAPS